MSTTLFVALILISAATGIIVMIQKSHKKQLDAATTLWKADCSFRDVLIKNLETQNALRQEKIKLLEERVKYIEQIMQQDLELRDKIIAVYCKEIDALKAVATKLPGMGRNTQICLFYLIELASDSKESDISRSEALICLTLIKQIYLDEGNKPKLVERLAAKYAPISGEKTTYLDAMLKELEEE